MIITTSKYERDPMQWHRWFAWYPVYVERGEIRWLEYVERRGVNTRDNEGDEVMAWTYRPESIAQ